ncbi:hypothetical protein L3Q67_01140 [Saccharothrix sp. AJ9571]|nr:hypothetical protein L3Q67_01140 [Saccharothrix sp. AJ9571]
MEPIDEAARARLAAEMELQRAALNKRWRHIAAEADIAYETLRAVRKGPGGIPPFTRRRIEIALQWPVGRIDEILGDSTTATEATERARLADIAMLLDPERIIEKKLRDDPVEHDIASVPDAPEDFVWAAIFRYRTRLANEYRARLEAQNHPDASAG